MVTEKQVGTIVHGAGINVDAFENQYKSKGFKVVRKDGWSEVIEVKDDTKEVKKEGWEAHQSKQG